MNPSEKTTPRPRCTVTAIAAFAIAMALAPTAGSAFVIEDKPGSETADIASGKEEVPIPRSKPIRATNFAEIIMIRLAAEMSGASGADRSAGSGGSAEGAGGSAAAAADGGRSDSAGGGRNGCDK